MTEPGFINIRARSAQRAAEDDDAADAAWMRFHRRMCWLTTAALAVALVAACTLIMMVTT